MEEVCRDVQIEPLLLQTQQPVQGNASDEPRLDISMREDWSQEKTFFDVRVTYPNAESNMTKSMDEIYLANEVQKKRAYSDRILNVEKSSFTPLVFSTTGGMGKECHRFNRRLAELISSKRNEILRCDELCTDTPSICFATCSSGSSSWFPRNWTWSCS